MKRNEDSDYDLEEMVNYNYLGVEITNTCEEQSKIQRRISKGNKCME